MLDGIPSMFHYDTPLTFLGARVSCPACKSIGRIVARGPRHPDDFMGHEPALDGDICVCKCHPAPIMISSQCDMFQSRASRDTMGERVDITPVPQPQGLRRPLTAGEIEMARKVFADSIDYGRMEIRYEDYIPWQGKGYGITPNGNIYLGEWLRRVKDFSLEEDADLKGFFSRT